MLPLCGDARIAGRDGFPSPRSKVPGCPREGCRRVSWVTAGRLQAIYFVTGVSREKSVPVVAATPSRTGRGNSGESFSGKRWAAEYLGALDLLDAVLGDQERDHYAPRSSVTPKDLSKKPTRRLPGRSSASTQPSAEVAIEQRGEALNVVAVIIDEVPPVLQLHGQRPAAPERELAERGTQRGRDKRF
jgi:hypothetical protein